MANRYWTGATNGNVGTNTNYSGDTLPANGDSLYFTAGYSNAPTSGFSALTSVSLARLFFGPGFEAPMALLADPFDIGATDIYFNSGGESCFLNITGGTGNVWVLGGLNGADMLNLAGTLGTVYASGGSGTLTVQNGAALAGLKVGGAPALNVNVGTSVTGFALCEAQSGNVAISSTATTCRAVGSGVLTIAGAANPSNVHLADRGRVVYTSSAGIGTLLQVFGDGAVFDGSSNTNAAAITIAEAEVWPGGTIDIRSFLDQYAITLTRELGGQILKFDKGSVAA